METKENYRWIKAVYITTGDWIKVRQVECGGNYWIDEDANLYSFVELDFTQVPEDELSLDDFKRSIEASNEASMRTQENLTKMLESIDAKSIADHKAKIDEREYWRTLRGEIFLAIRSDYSSNMHAADYTKQVVDELYKQDKDFFERNFGCSE